MRVENNLVMVIMGLLAVAVVLLVLYAMYPMLMTWAAAIARCCCRRQAALLGDYGRSDMGTLGTATTDFTQDVYSRWTSLASSVSFKTASRSLMRHTSGSGMTGSRGRRVRRSERIPNSRGVVWNARVFEGRPTVVTMGAQDALADLDSWRYTTRQLEAHWHVPLDASSSGDSIEIAGNQVSAVPSSEEALAVVHPMSPLPPLHTLGAAAAAAQAMARATSAETKDTKLTTASEDDPSGSTTSEEERDRRRIVCPSVPANALLRYVWGARPLAEGAAGPAAAGTGVTVPSVRSLRPSERAPQMVEVFAAGPSSIPGPSRLSSASPRSPAAGGNSPSLSSEHKPPSPPTLPYTASDK